MDIRTRLQVDIALVGYHITITFVYLYVHIRIVTDLNGVVTISGSTVRINKDTDTAIRSGGLVSLDVYKGVPCDEVVIVSLNPCDLGTIRVYLVPCAGAVALMDPLLTWSVIKFPKVTTL